MAVVSEQLAHAQATRLPVASIATYLQDILGQRLTAVVAGVGDAKAVGKWARGERAPHPDAEARLRNAFQVAELLMQSVDDIIRIFPAWPEEHDARFATLRAQGGFLVSAEQQNGEVTSLVVESTVGGTLHVLNPWDRGIQLDGKTLEPDERGVVRLQTEPSQVLAFSPKK